MNRQLLLKDFTFVRMTNTLGHYWSHVMPGGEELCLESCMAGYCVALYDRHKNILGEKRCTEMSRDRYSDPIILLRALELANERIGITT